MSANPARPVLPVTTGYIRGGGGVEIDRRRLLGACLGLCVAGLLAVTVLLAVAAAGQNDRRTQLKRDGVPVQATVLGCVGLASGSGATVYSYSCQARYTLDGETHVAAIKGTNSDYPAGQTLDAVAVRGRPSLLSTEAAVQRESASWTAYIATVVTGSLTIVLAGAALGWHRRRPGRAGKSGQGARRYESSSSARSEALRTP